MMRSETVVSGAVLVVGLPGPELDGASARLLRDVGPGGVILFARNIDSVEQLRALVAAVRRLLPQVVFYVDAEGGRVDRLAKVLAPAPAADRLAVKPPAVARRAGRWVGYGLRLFDLDVALAPVVDLDRGRRHNALDRRYLGERPTAVVARGRAFLGGLHASGVGGCVKHFPGLGGAREDTHLRSSVVDLDARELVADLEPFRRLASLAAAVMVGHAGYPALDPEGLPASLSPAIASGLLRRRLGFQGLLFSDDLEMDALRAWGSLAERAVRALEAGCDGLLLCRHLEAAPAVAERLEAAGSRRRLVEATARLQRYRRHLAGLRDSAPRCFRLQTVRRRLAAL